MSPRSSLIIATYNWEPALELVLLSVLRLTELPDEVIVADDGSGPATSELIARFRERFDERRLPLLHVWHEDTGFRLAAIRNKAIAAASGEYILQIDGDIVLHPRFVAAHRHFARVGSYVQGGRVMLSPAATQQAIAEQRTRFSPLAPGLRNRVNAVHAPWLAATVSTEQNPLRRTRGCHMAYWRDDAIRVNGFNEEFEGWGREDSEFASRLLNAGVRRRNFKFGAIGYHLWHKERAQSALDRNHELYATVQAEGHSWCERGISQHLAGSPNASEVGPLTASMHQREIAHAR
jgi:glycosyltransferase involved in cell wall biosynthesis